MSDHLHVVPTIEELVAPRQLEVRQHLETELSLVIWLQLISFLKSLQCEEHSDVSDIVFLRRLITLSGQELWSVDGHLGRVSGPPLMGAAHHDLLFDVL